MVQRACGKATPWQGGHCGKWKRGGHGVQQLGCTLACPEWMCREKPNNPATPFPVKEEVADFLPGVQGRMGQTAQGVTHVGRMVGLAGVGSVPRAQSFCCCQPLRRVSELLPPGGRCPCIWNDSGPSPLLCWMRSKGSRGLRHLEICHLILGATALPFGVPLFLVIPLAVSFLSTSCPKETGSCYSSASFLPTFVW